MTLHDPHANKHPFGGRPWTAEEHARLDELIRAGFTYSEIADDIRRTKHAVKSMVNSLKQTAEQKEERRRRENQTRQPVIRMRIEHVHERAPTIPPEVIEDRNQRYLAPRSLTAILMGDPEPNRRRA